MCLRLFCILLAAVSGTRGWGYCECRAQVQAGFGRGVQSLQGGSSRIAARWSRVPSRPARARSFPSFPASPPRSAMQLRGWRALPGWCWARRSRGSNRPGVGIWDWDPSGSWCLGLRVGGKGGTGDPARVKVLLGAGAGLGAGPGARVWGWGWISVAEIQAGFCDPD